MFFVKKRTGTISLLILVLLASSPGCAPEFATKPAVHFPFAYAQHDCAPNDALALQFYFTTKQGKCGEYKEPFLMISINRNLPKSAPKDYTIGPDRNAVGASRCLRPGQCESVAYGTLHLERFLEGKSAVGEYELHFQDGSVEKARFEATWCFIHFLCG
jgi:hypothetical protein